MFCLSVVFNCTYLTAHLTYAHQQALVCAVVLLLLSDVDAGIFSRGMRASQCIETGVRLGQLHLQNEEGAVCSKANIFAYMIPFQLP